MLHKIEQVCSVYFAWVRQLQNDLLSAVCSPPDITAAQVTPGWLLAQCPAYPSEWLTSLCQKKDKISKSNHCLIEHLQTMANATLGQKELILDIFSNNQAVEQGFINDNENGYRLRKITEIDNATIQKAYRGFFEIFYNPEFYNGYPVAEGISFDRKNFIDQFVTENKIGVCVLCDDSLNDPDVDHFFSKSEFPDLALHIGNLVPICKSCNGRARKGEKAPLDFVEQNQFVRWYHPYFCNAENYGVQFELRDEDVWPFLTAGQDIEQDRLHNLNYLIDLEERWKQRLYHIARTTIKQLKMAEYQNLEGKLLEMAESVACGIREIPFSILHAGYLKRAGEGCELLLEEIREALLQT